MEFQKTITGIIVIFIGAVLFYFAFRTTYIILIYGIIVIGLGIAILLNNKENIIEQIKKKK
jgi:fucose permease